MDNFLIVLIVIIVGGILGGAMNAILAPSDEKPNISFIKNIFLGVGAAFVIPLFLNSISANLIDEIVGSASQPGKLSKTLVLMGFCILAAITSKRFLNSLSEKIFHDISENRNKIESLDKKTDAVARDANMAKLSASRAEEIVAPLVEEDVESVPGAAFAAVSEQDSKDSLSAEDRAILLATTESKFSMRSLSGIARDTKIDSATANKSISDLLVRGLIKQTTSSSGQPRWYATSKGRATLSG